MVAGVSAVVLLITMFLPWYGVSVTGSIGAFSGSASKDFDAWEAFGGRDVIIFLVTVVVLAYLLVRLLGVVAPAAGVDASLVIAGLGALAAVLILIGIIHIPDSAGGAVGNVNLPRVSTDHGRKCWLFLGSLAACCIAYGGWGGSN